MKAIKHKVPIWIYNHQLEEIKRIALKFRLKNPSQLLQEIGDGELIVVDSSKPLIELDLGLNLLKKKDGGCNGD
nr:hypothetical protein [Candidatus Woesearchaeota archaeon]